VAASILGVINEGDVARTTFPDPVVVAAEMAVPFPLKIPVIDVESVIAGVVVAVDTVPANPLAETTETLVTVPDPPPPLAEMAILFPTVVKVMLVPAEIVTAPVRVLKLETPAEDPPPAGGMYKKLDAIFSRPYH
jgi:hypothetical protein